MTEAELKALMQAGLAGDAAAHARLLAALAPRLRAYFARRMGANPGAAEDLVQETLLAIHLKRFEHRTAATVKVDGHITFPLELNMTAFLSSVAGAASSR